MIADDLTHNRNACICSPIDIYKDVYSSIIHNSPKLETFQISINSRMDKQNIVYSQMAMHIIHAIIWINLTDYVSKKRYKRIYTMGLYLHEV